VGWNNLATGRDVVQQILLSLIEAMPGAMEPILNGYFVKPAYAFLREFLRRKDGSVSDTESLRPQGADNPVSEVISVMIH
jgi:hypothetical protein